MSFLYCLGKIIFDKWLISKKAKTVTEKWTWNIKAMSFMWTLNKQSQTGKNKHTILILSVIFHVIVSHVLHSQCHQCQQPQLHPVPRDGNLLLKKSQSESHSLHAVNSQWKEGVLRDVTARGGKKKCPFLTFNWDDEVYEKCREMQMTLKINATLLSAPLPPTYTHS